MLDIILYIFTDSVESVLVCPYSYNIRFVGWNGMGFDVCGRQQGVTYVFLNNGLGKLGGFASRIHFIYNVHIMSNVSFLECYYKPKKIYRKEGE